MRPRQTHDDFISEIANDAKYGYKGGRDILQSLSSATTLELLTDAGEVVLSRELNLCPTFGNLRTLSLGEWCIAADFDALIFLLQHSPNTQKLVLQLKINFNARKASETGIKLQGRSFTCKDLRMVKITCSKDDGRVHQLANLFRANGIPLEKIYVCRSGSACIACNLQASCVGAARAMGSGSKAASRKSSSSWRSLLDGCLGRTMAAGENIPASDGLAEQPPPIVTNHDLPLAASNSNLHAFTFAELCAATEGFASRNQIGSGEFGTAYRGFLEDGVRPGLPAQPVAVKRRRWRVDDYVEGMVKEAMFLGELQLRHPCLVRMIGYCCEEEHRLLVYEFMAHGSLDDYFFKLFGPPVLPWSTRLSIVLATAKGLVSLHGAEKPLICGEFNASDILLDSDNNAKISLSGLRLDTRASDGSVTTTRSRLGTPRGSAPEYVMSGCLTPKCDVYSFGVVLLEILITGMKWVDMKRPVKEERDLLEYARPKLEDPAKLASIMDRALKGIYPVAAAHKAALVTYKCLHIEPEKRPDMSDVVEALDLLTGAAIMEDQLPVPAPVSPNSNLHRFTFAELSAATGGFASRNKIGSGSFGTVYKGSLEDNIRPGLPSQSVAVKRARGDDYHSEEHLKDSIFLGELQPRQPSLVKMIGYCYEGLHRLLVYELMGHGSLANYLSNDIRVVLSWSTRLSIALATAKGLLSLHGEEKPLVASKFNACNILLDSYNNVKLSDLWFARKYEKDDDPNMYTLVTTGYGCAPEYVMSGDLTMKSDVYCFGVVLLEILTGQRLAWVTRASEHNPQNLRPRLRDPLELRRVMDPMLKGIYPVAAAHEACMVAYRCLHASPGNRPSMLAVVEALDLLVGVTVVDEVDVGQTSTRS